MRPLFAMLPKDKRKKFNSIFFYINSSLECSSSCLATSVVWLITVIKRVLFLAPWSCSKLYIY